MPVTQAAASPPASEHSIAPSDSISNPPEQKPDLTSSAKASSVSSPAKPAKAAKADKQSKRPLKRALKGMLASETEAEGEDVKPDVSDQNAQVKRGKTKKAKVECGDAYGEAVKGETGLRGSSGAKARLSAEAKQAIGEEIVRLGAAAVDAASLASAIGLTAQQVKSQIIDNRTNVRRQLMQVCKTLQ